MDNIATPRPMTHALLKSILANLQAEVVRIVIHDLQSNTFYASIVLRHDTRLVNIDARPSDAITLALEAKAPIFVAHRVLGAVRTVNLSAPAQPPQVAKSLGAHLQALDATLAQAFHLPVPEGVLVSFVEAGSQAERHGLQRGDVITDVDGRHITVLADLLDIFKHKTKGQEFLVQVTRDQRPFTLRLPFFILE
jgi:S1-C subfamily serine protease